MPAILASVQDMTKQNNFTVKEEEANVRLDIFVADRKPELSRSYIQKLILAGHITIGDAKAKSSHKVNSGDVIRIAMPEIQSYDELSAEDIPLDIVYEDDAVIVVDKPAGMVVHPAAGVSSGTLANALISRISPELISITPERPGIVHRLDKGTSGTIIVAKIPEAYYRLVDQFKEHSVNRKYMALICGDPKQDRGIITAPIGRSRRDRKKMAVTSANSKIAITHFSVIERYGQFSLLEIAPKTGRTHQIRVHLSHIGYSVAGDPTYGGRNRAIRTAISQNVKMAFEKLTRQALHARLLGFIHPCTDEYMDFSAQIPEDMQNVIDALEQEI